LRQVHALVRGILMKVFRGLTAAMVAASAAFLTASPAPAEGYETVPARSASEGEGPYPTLVIRGVTLVDGTGAPPLGPVDITIKNNRIAAIDAAGTPGVPLKPDRDPKGATREIDGTGMTVLPGFVDVHGHDGDPKKAPNASYAYKVWLAHGVTSVLGIPFYFGEPRRALDEAAESAANRIVAPRLYPYAVIGDLWDGGAIDSPEQARKWVRWARQRGYLGAKFFNSETPEVMAAALDELRKQKMGSVAHLAQGGVARTNARQAGAMGLQTVTHFYGHFESLLKDRQLPAYPVDYNMLDEQDRFYQVSKLADQIVEPGGPEWNAYLGEQLARGVIFNPTFEIYSAGRDVMRARNADWHAKYTLPSLWAFFQPSRENHGSYWYDWTTEKEVSWRRFYRPYMQLMNDYKNMGGRVTVGSDPGFIYQTWGFSYILELEMLQEAGFSPLEVIKAATSNGAHQIFDPQGASPPIGTVEVGKLADLVIVPGNPLQNLKLLYGTGYLKLGADNKPERVGGIRWTIKDGIVYDAPKLLEEVAAMVAAKKAEAPAGN
jgi:imidazolonepropionase-like amidohydrolase